MAVQFILMTIAFVIMLIVAILQQRRIKELNKKYHDLYDEGFQKYYGLGKLYRRRYIFVKNAPPEWLPAKRIEKHTTRKGGDADDLTIIEELHNRILKQSEQIERLKNEKAALAEKISRNYPAELLKAVNAIKEGLTEKKHKIEKIEKGLATLDDIFSILTN